MKKFKLGKILICLASAVVLSVSALSFSACNIETDHPEAVITYEFNGNEYAVKYTLYRNLRPHTVRHFIELADSGFYDNTVVHDFDTSDWFTGGYSYDAEDYTAKKDNANTLTEYFSDNSKEADYVRLYADGVLTPTVYKDSAYNPVDQTVGDASEYLPVLFGEFFNNVHQEITNDPLNAELGCLKMFYYTKESTQKVCVKPASSDFALLPDYKYNCATSVFGVQTAASSGFAKSAYAVFAKLADTDAFDKLLDAVNDFIENEHGNTRSNFYTSAEVRVDNLDEYSNKPEADKGIEVTFKAPKTPIVLKTVKITKY
ncbi:MAG: peptidylprolyl isomerase [Clostridia bacterium]|nr:peptidylprolyl isomerase [Clostridia bacterium]